MSITQACNFETFIHNVFDSYMYIVLYAGIISIACLGYGNSLNPVHMYVITCLLQLQIKNMKYAPQVEDFFMGKDAYSFVCESKQDYDLFCREVYLQISSFFHS